MTRRENLLKVLRHEGHDRLPAFFAIDDFHNPEPPEGSGDLARSDPTRFLVELSRYLGLDVVVRVAPPIVRTIQPAGTSVTTEDLGNGRTATVWVTPKGTIRLVGQQSVEAHTVFTIEHPVKEIGDYEILIDLLERSETVLHEENVTETKRVLEILGDQGIAYAVGPPSPIMDLARTWVGLEELVYHMADARDVVEAALETMSRHYLTEYELLAGNTPCEVLVLWDDANSLYLSRSMFEKYSVPILRKFAEIAHAHGKVLVNHTCGRIKAFLDLYPRTGADAIDWLAPPPVGDVEPVLAQEVFGARMTAMSALPPWVMKNGTVEQVGEFVHLLLDSVDVTGNLVFMIPAPTGSPVRNIRRAVEILVEDYGVPANTSSLFGSILSD